MAKRLEDQIKEQEAKIEAERAKIIAIETPEYLAERAKLEEKFNEACAAYTEAQKDLATLREEVSARLKIGTGTGNHLLPTEEFAAAIATSVGADSASIAYDHKFMHACYTLRDRLIDSHPSVVEGIRQKQRATDIKANARHELDHFDLDKKHIEWRLFRLRQDLNELREKMAKRDAKVEEKAKIVALNPASAELAEQRAIEIRRKLKQLAEGELEFTFAGITVNKKVN